MWKPWISSGFPTWIQAEHRLGDVSAPRIAAFCMKSNKKTPISLQNWDIPRFCAHPIPAPTSPLTSIWSTGTEFLLDQLQHFVIFLLREKNFKKKKSKRKKEKRRRLAHLISVSACHCTLFRGISWIFSLRKRPCLRNYPRAQIPVPVLTPMPWICCLAPSSCNPVE